MRQPIEISSRENPMSAMSPVSESATDGRIALTMRESAAALGLSERTIWQAVKDGRLKAAKIGRSVRIHREELDQFLRTSQR